MAEGHHLAIRSSYRQNLSDHLMLLAADLSSDPLIALAPFQTTIGCAKQFSRIHLGGMHPMPDNNGGRGLDLLTKATNDIAREIGKMDPNDPLRPGRIKRTSRANRTQQVNQSRTEQVHLCEDGRSCKRGGRVEAEGCPPSGRRE